MHRTRVASLLLTLSLVVPLTAVARRASAAPPADRPTKHFARVSVAPGGKELRGGIAGYEMHNVAASDDGSVVVFGSIASNLTPDDPSFNPTWSGLYLKDTRTGHVELLQSTSHFYAASVSADGRYVAYQSACGIERLDRQTNHRRRVDDPTADAGTCYATGPPRMTADGRFVVFSRRLWVDTQPQQVYRYDAVSDTIELVSRTDAGTPGDGLSQLPAISDDGKVVAFFSDATNLGGGPGRLVVRDDGSDHLEVVEGILSTYVGPNCRMSVSADGRRIAAVVGVDAWLVDRQTQVTTRIMGPTGPFPGDGQDMVAAMDAAGTRVVVSAPLSVDQGITSPRQFYAYDVGTATLTALVRGMGGAAPNGKVAGPSLSRDGKTLFFAAYASNLVVDDTNGLADAFALDIATGAVRRLSSTSTGVQQMGGWGTTQPAGISADGRMVVYLTAAVNSSSDPPSIWGGEFVLDRKRGRVRKIFDGVQRTPAISDDGRYVLVPSAGVVLDGNLNLAFAAVVDLETGTPKAVHLPPGQLGYGPMAMSRDGKVIAFVGPSRSDPSLPISDGDQIWRCDVGTDHCDRISQLPDGTPADGWCEDPVLDESGRFLAFRTMAPNLTEGTGRTRVLVYDHLTQTLEHVSLPPPGVLASEFSPVTVRPSISADGRFVAFSAAHYNLSGSATDVFVRDRQLGVTELVSSLPGGGANPWICVDPSLSADGRYVAFASQESWAQNSASKIYVHDRQKGETELVLPAELNAPARWPTLSGDGKHLVFVTSASNLVEDDTNWAPDVFVMDLEPKLAIQGVWPPSVETGKPTTIEIHGSGFQSATPGGMTTQAAGPVVRIGGVAATDVRVVSDTLIVATLPPVGSGAATADVSVDFGAPDVVAELPVSVRRVTTGGAQADADGDGMTDAYELAMGFDAAQGNASEDADGDGVPNAQEFLDGTHPLGGQVQGYLAEGATTIFQDQLALLNPGTTTSRVLVKAQTATGDRVMTALVVPPTSRATLDMGTLPGLESAEFSTVVEATGQVLFSRTIVWGDGEGSHAETAIPQPALRWYFAEGATHSGLQLFYLLQNPQRAVAHVTVRYLRPAPAAPVLRTYEIGAQRRLTVWANVDPEIDGTDLSAEVTSDVPIIAERAVYRDAPGLPFAAGHESAGVTAPATQWFLAEGATGPYFDLFVLVANPNAGPAACDVRFLLPDGTVIPRALAVAPSSRTNIWVDAEGGRLTDTAVSTQVTCDVPVIVERAMWWPGDASTWTEAHNSVGATTTGTRWAVPDGEEGGQYAAETYILLANTSAFAGAAQVTVMFEDGTTATRTVALPASSRTNVAMGAPEAAGGFGALVANRRFGAVIVSVDTGSGQPQLVVERAIYSSSASGRTWAAGSNTLGTKLQ